MEMDWKVQGRSSKSWRASSRGTRGNAVLNPMQISCLQDININRTRVQKLSRWRNITGRQDLCQPAPSGCESSSRESTQTENLCDVTYLAKSGSSAFVNRSAKLCSATADTSDSP